MKCLTISTSLTSGKAGGFAQRRLCGGDRSFAPAVEAPADGFPDDEEIKEFERMIKNGVDKNV